MMHYIIAKNTHSDVIEARKLEPLIEQADFVSYEQMGLTFEQAESMEKAFSVIGSKTSRERTYYRKQILSMLPKTDYSRGILDLTLKNRSRVIFLERYSHEQSLSILQREDQFRNKLRFVIPFAQGRLEDAIEEAWQMQLEIKAHVHERDEHMAHNALCVVPSRIKELYPGVTGHNFLVVLGGYHNLETLLSNVETVSLIKDISYTHWYSTLLGQVIKGQAEFNSSKEILSRIMLAQMFEAVIKPHHLRTKMINLMVTTMGYAEAQELSLRLSHSQYHIEEIKKYIIDQGFVFPRIDRHYRENINNLENDNQL